MPEASQSEEKQKDFSSAIKKAYFHGKKCFIDICSFSGTKFDASAVDPLTRALSDSYFCAKTFVEMQEAQRAIDLLFRFQQNSRKEKGKEMDSEEIDGLRQALVNIDRMALNDCVLRMKGLHDGTDKGVSSAVDSLVRTTNEEALKEIQ